MSPIGKRKRRSVAKKQIKMNSTTALLPTTSSMGENNSTIDHNFRRYSCPPPAPYRNFSAGGQFNEFIPRGQSIPQNGLQILPCSRPYDQLYCFNGGHCYNPLMEMQHQNEGNGPLFMLPFCRCAPNFHGPRCEHLFDANFYGIGQNNSQQIPRPLSPPSPSSASTPNSFFLPICLLLFIFLFIKCKFLK